MITLLLLVVVSLVGVGIALHTGWGRNKLRGYIADKLAQVFPGGVEIGALEGSVLSTVTLRDVRISRLDGAPLITAATVDVDLALLPLILHTARIDALRADDVHVYARKQPPRPSAPRGEPSRWDLALPDIVVHHATIELTDAHATLDVDLRGGGFAAAGEPPVFVASIAGSWRERALPFTSFAGVELGEQVTLPFAVVAAAGGTLAARDLVVDLDQPAGTAVAIVPATAVAPWIALPADAIARVSAASSDGTTQLEIAGRVGTADVYASLDGSVPARTATGLVTATVPDLAELTRGRAAGAARAVATLDAHWGHVTGTLSLHGDLPRVPAHDATIAFDASCTQTTAFARGTGDGGLEAYVTAEGRCDGDTYRVTDAHAIATAHGVAGVTGVLGLDVHARGTVWPLDLAVDGTTTNREVAYDELRAARVTGPVSAHVTRTGTLGEAHLDLAGVAQLASELGAGHVDVANRADGSIDVAATGWPRGAKGVELHARGLVVPGEPTRLALADHHITLPHGTWAGRGGTVTIGPTIAVRGVVDARETSTLATRLDFDRTTKQLGAHVDVAGFDAAAIDPAFHGTAGGALDLSRAGGRWGAHGNFAVTGFAAVAGAEPVDGKVTVDLANQRATASVHAENPQVGAAEFVLDVAAPANPMSAAWLTLPRDAVRTARLTLHHVDLGPFGASGHADGQIDIAPRVASGTVTVAGVVTKLGTAGGDLTLAPREGDVGAQATATLEGVGEASATARLVLPEHPFDPAAWRTLGRGVIREAAADADDIAVDPALLARFGVHAQLTGRATVDLALGNNATEAKLAVDVTGVTGEGLVEPVAAHVEVGANPHGTHVVATTTATRLGLGTLTGDLPITLDRWIADPRSVRYAPVTARWTLAPIAAGEVLALFGRHDLRGGTLDGRGTLRGTVDTPIVDGFELTAHDVAVTPRLGGTPLPVVEELKLVATWGGAAGTATLTGRETGGGTLFATATGRPDALAAVTGALRTHTFDIAPITVALPDEAAGIAGVIDSDLGLASGGRVTGSFGFSGGKAPIGSAIGTLRDAHGTIKLDARTIIATIDGNLGAGTVHFEANADPAGTTTRTKLVLTRVSPIGVLQPIIDATIGGTLVRSGTEWRGDLRVTDATVRIPRRSGTKLLDTGVPSDLVVAGHTVKRDAPTHAVAHPHFVADIVVEPTRIVARDVVEGFGAEGEASSKHLQLVAGNEGATLTGVVDLAGNAEVLGRTYQLGASSARFDGTFDPWLAVVMTHDFATLQLTATITGPASKPVPFFSSEPGGYSQDQLFTFFVGGEPGGDPNSQTRDAVAAAATSLVSARLGRELSRVLPVHVETSCQPATASTSASCTVGRWLTPRWFLAFRPHYDPRPDENPTDILGQYYLGREILIEGTGGGGHSGADFLWRHRW